MEKADRKLVVVTKCGELNLSAEEVENIPLFKNVFEATNERNCLINVDFKKRTVQALLFWFQISNITNIMDWEEVICLFIFADYVGCQEFIRYFVRTILPGILNERNTCYARYLLSIDNNPEYIKIVEEHDDEWVNHYECRELEKIDNREDHSYDNMLTYVPFEELRWLFPRLSFSRRETLARLFPTSHSYGKKLREMLLEYKLIIHKSNLNIYDPPSITNKGVNIPYRRNFE